MKRAIYRWTAALALLGTLSAIALASNPRILPEDESPVISRRAPVGTVSQTLTNATVISNPINAARERAVFDVTLPAFLDSVHLDLAELVMTVTTVYDPTDPLVLTVAPVTDRSMLEQMAQVADWTGEDEGMSMRYSTPTFLNCSEDAIEVRLDLTPIVELWLSERIPNRGVVVRSLSEDKSTFHLKQSGLYNGADARLEVKYSCRSK